MLKPEHIGIAVKELATSVPLFEKLLNSQCYKTESVESEKVNTAFFKTGDTKIELLESASPDGVIAKFIEKKGEGIHHIAFEVADIDAEMKRLESEGFTLLNTVPKQGADNKLVCFLHPKGTNGVLIELCMEKNDRMNVKQNTWKDIFFAAVFLLLLAGALLSYKRVEDLIKANNEVSHTNAIKLKLEEVLFVIKSGESAQRGYQLSRDVTFLTPYKNALPSAHLLMDEIAILTRDNPQQTKNCNEVRQVLDARFSALDNGIKKIDSGLVIGRDGMLRGSLKMDMLRNAILKMQLAEDKLLAERIQEKKRYESVSPLFVLLFTFLILIVIVFAFKKIRKDRQKLKKINSSLEFKNREVVATKNFMQLLLDSSVDLIASMDMDLNYLTINQKSIETIGKEPEELIGKNILDLNPALRGTDTHKAMLRALKGEIMHLELLQGLNNREKYFDVFFIPLFENHKITGMLSITRDVTPLVDANNSLINKNAELERSNKELSSFNYIASHDLQEPLRKIQIFSDRILEESKEELSDKTKKYFERITDASARMRKLIEALLSYSLANRGEIKSVATDLNKIVADAARHINEDQPQNTLSIESEALPVANIIPVQFQQLLLNLLGNSVKYSKQDVPPVVKISSEIIESGNMNDVNAMPGRTYLKISFADNGIGFDQAYVDKIFDLFQRLHTKNEYSGTGIGLAICKKIMENHDGFIKASGKLNEGAVFDLYFPV